MSAPASVEKKVPQRQPLDPDAFLVSLSKMFETNNASPTGTVRVSFKRVATNNIDPAKNGCKGTKVVDPSAEQACLVRAVLGDNTISTLVCLLASLSSWRRFFSSSVCCRCLQISANDSAKFQQRYASILRAYVELQKAKKKKEVKPADVKEAKEQKS